jgi:DNA-binding PadR family transcriptional regulator
MGTFQRGRHAQAFILICLADGPAYGLELQERIERFTQGDRLDRAFLYRTLNKLHQEERVSCRTDASQPGGVRKFYSLTDSGYRLLDDFEKDIRSRVKNLSAFLDKYEQIKSNQLKDT